VVTIDADRRIREFNPAAEALFGRSRAEVIGLDMPETLVPERLRPHFVDAMAGYLAAGNPGEFASRIRLRALRSDGTERPIELTPLPVTVGEGTFLLGFVRDASDLEAAATAVAEGEARFRLLSDLTPVGIVQTDVDGEVRFVNDKWCQMSGIRAEQVIGQNWRFTINPEDVRRIDVSRGEDETEVATDCRLRTAGGGELWVHAVVRRVLDADGNLTGRVAALTDVSARKQAETAGEQDRRQLAAQNVQLRDLNQARVRYPGHGLARAAHAADLDRLVRRADPLGQRRPRGGGRGLPRHHPAQRRAAAAGGR